LAAIIPSPLVAGQRFRQNQNALDDPRRDQIDMLSPVRRGPSSTARANQAPAAT
jgi:hypothetical protein